MDVASIATEGVEYKLANGALLITLIVFGMREFFSWLSRKNLQQSEAVMKTMSDNMARLSDKVEKAEVKIDSMLQMNRTMYDWHDKSDEDGVKIWYVRRSLEEALQENVRAINILAKNSETQTRLLEDMINQNKEIHKDQIVLSKLLEKLFDKQ